MTAAFPHFDKDLFLFMALPQGEIPMIYSILWINTVPGTRDDGLAHLQKWAQIVEEDFKTECGILLQVTSGSPYLAGVVTAHENMGAMVSNIDAQASSEQFQKWNEDSEGLLDWASSEWQTFRQLSAESNPLPNFISVIASDIKPGQLMQGREFMARVADHITSTYGVVCLEGGSHYRHSWVMNYDSLDRYEEVNLALGSDEVWAKLAGEMLNYFDNTNLEKNIGRYV